MRSEPHLVEVFGANEQPGQQEVQVPVEQPLLLRVNGGLAATIMRQPGDDIELAVGYCLTEGLIADAGAVLTVRHCETDDNTVDVLIQGEPPEHPRLVGTSCMDGAELSEAQLPEPLQLDRETAWSVADMFAMPPQFRDHQQQHRLSGGVHAAALFDQEANLVVLREDVGRYSAADKVVGYCALGKLPMADMVLMVSGRASSMMVVKTVRAGIPVLATMSNTSSLGLELADRLGLTLVTYLRGKKFRVCTHPFRICQR